MNNTDQQIIEALVILGEDDPSSLFDSTIDERLTQYFEGDSN